MTFVLYNKEKVLPLGLKLTFKTIFHYMSVTCTYCVMYLFVHFNSSLSLISMKKGIYTVEHP